MLAVSIATIVLVEMFVRSDLSHSAFAPVGVILFCAPVAIRRRHPVAAVCAEAAVVLATPGFDVPGSTVVLVMVLSYSCAAHAPLRAAVLGTGVLFVAVALVGGPDVLSRSSLACGVHSGLAARFACAVSSSAISSNVTVSWRRRRTRSRSCR